MFENLQERLQKTFKSLRGQAVLTEENIQETLRELRLALLEADVNFKVVKQFIDQVQAKAVGQQVMSALSPGEQVIKIVRDELVEVLGKDTVRVKFASQPEFTASRLASLASRSTVAVFASATSPW
jgi:signal recognition particle subunit SRP54